MSVGPQKVVVPVKRVLEVLERERVREVKVPGTNDRMRGWVSVRGDIMAHLSLAHLLDGTNAGDSRGRILVVVQLPPKLESPAGSRVAVEVDSVDDMVSLAGASIREVAGTAAGVARGIVNLPNSTADCALLLDVEALRRQR